MSKILIVEDEPKGMKLLRLRLEEAGHQVRGTGAYSGARELLDSELLDLMITDVRLPDGNGIELAGEAINLQADLPVIVITAYGAISDAVRAMKLGAMEYVQKPFELEAMALLVERALEQRRVCDEHAYLIDQTLEGEREVDLVGRSQAMADIRESIAKVAASRSTVLLQGESGTGKELVAQAIHQASREREQPLIKVNCPGIPAQLFESELFGHMKGSFTGAFESRRGKFELAGGGNILLDEVSEIPMELQSKLLRVLENRRFTRVGGTSEIEVKARVIAATNRNLKRLVREGRFRGDLYFRLNVFPVELPSLRDRREDVEPTALHLLSHVSHNCGLIARGISAEAVSALIGYDWPGNVRELRNVLERALVLAGGGIIEIEHLPWEIQERRDAAEHGPETFGARVEAFKKTILLEALEKNQWRKKDAAKQLGLSQRALSHHVAKLNLDDYRGPDSS